MVGYSVLDQSPMRAGAAPGHALRETLMLARHADALGYTRYWLAEHHALGSLASSAPEVLIGHVASVTERMRIGSGGVLLPNHRPIHVAEQFRTLEALHPGRIDLGIGRSEGATHDATVLAFGRPEDNTHGAGFDAQLDELLAFGGARPFPPDHPLAGVRAMPDDVPLPPVFLLGSSPNSAVTAARKGLGYGFAVHTNPDATVEALRRYREGFVPARDGDRPHAILAVKVVVGEDDAHAEALVAPQRLSFARARLRQPAELVPIAVAVAHRWTAEEREALGRSHPEADVIGGPARVRRELAELVAAANADEVLAITITYDPADRRASYTRLAAAVGLTPAAAAA
jgi:luciferase family oxidoreductase group 1